MAIIGGQINPALYPQPDYSGVIQSARGQSQAMADIGASIGGVIKDFGSEKKRINQEIIKGKSALQFAKANYPELAGRIDEIGKIFSDVNVSKADQAAAGSQMGEFVTAMIRGQEFNKEVELKKKSLAIQEAESIGQMDAKDRELEAKLNQRTAEKIAFGNRDLAVVKDAFGNLYDPESDRLITDLEAYAAGRNDFGPKAEGSVDSSPGVLPDLITPELGDNVSYGPNTVEDSIATANAIANSINQGRTDTSNVSPIVGRTIPTMETPTAGATTNKQAPLIPRGTPRTTGGSETYRDFTPEEIARYGSEGQVSSSGRAYPIRPPSGTEFIVNPDGSTTYRQGANVGAKADQQKKAEESKVDKAMALTQDLNLLEEKAASMAPGVSGAVGRIVAEQIPATPQAENKEIIDRVISTLTLENLQAMRNNSPTGAALGNVSDKDTGLMRDSATSLRNAQSPESFKRELIRLKNLQHDVIYGSERVLKNKLEKGEITQSEFDEAARKAPSQYINEKGVVTDRKTIPIAPISDLQSIYDKYLTPETAK